AGGKPHRLLASALAEGRVEEEGWRVRKDGTRFWADVVITPVRSDAGEHIGFIKVTRDLTERVGAERRIQESELRYRLLLESVKDYAIVMLDDLGQISTWNSGAERITGYAAQDV